MPRAAASTAPSPAAGTPTTTTASADKDKHTSKLATFVTSAMAVLIGGTALVATSFIS
jgi:hypothetical protein